MAEAQRAPGTRRSPQPGRRPRLEPAGVQNQRDLAAEIVRGYAGNVPRDVYEARTRFYRRAPHEVLGADGYALLSRYFARYVLPQALMSGDMTKLQCAVLSNIVGRAERGVAHAIQREIAEEIGSNRSSVSPALKHLAARNYIRSVGRGVWQLNPLIAYKGNGDEQQAFLYELRALALENGFPDTVGLAPARNEDKESTAC
ncbi:replication/maintenance protein RepL [Kitasatospora sp. NBC_00240]|uniref:Replication/maintenance protein RepL n=1 Tax=Kitasatospora herbaricolor TaxID=68217 RepID=A0ABZ1WMF7_9ACTN|nr:MULTISPECIES: replication/maintenance protein RepL [Kitasatospora]MCX5216162.1 replication/maintenance protein RepL [Kitasatospora sp. NBC_00240]